MASKAPPKKKASSTNKPLGVKEDYVARPRTAPAGSGDTGMEAERAAYAYETQQIAVPPTFYETDLERPNSWSGGSIASLQQDLVAAGLLSKKGFSLGLYDDATQTAYSKVLQYANKAGIKSIDEALGTFLARPRVGLGGGASGGGRAPFRAELPNPDDIKALIDATVPNILGRTLTEAEKEAVVGAYQAVVGGAQQQAYNTAESGGTVTQAPDASTFIAKRVKELNPEEADLYGKFSKVGNVLGILGIGGQGPQAREVGM